jgi:hypothetical protein
MKGENELHSYGGYSLGPSHGIYCTPHWGRGWQCVAGHMLFLCGSGLSREDETIVYLQDPMRIKMASKVEDYCI